MKKYSLLFISLLFLSFLSSCFECETCHRVKVYDNATTGVFDVPDIQEVCSRSERRTLLKSEFEGIDAGGSFKSFWVCDVLVDKEDDK